LKNIPDGKYELQCGFLGYGKNVKATFTIAPDNRNIRVGVVEMEELSQMLGEVVVSGQKSTYITRIDKKIFNAGSDLMSISRSASDLMQNIPSVQVEWREM
jgi:hypothetical protein